MPVSKSQLSESTKVQNIEMPAQSRILNFHIWLLLAGKLLFEDFNMTPGFVCKSEKEYQELLPILNFLHSHQFNKKTFREILAPVLSSCTIHDVDQVIIAGQQMHRQWALANQVLNAEVADYLEENRISYIRSDKADTKLFRSWYEAKYETTSQPHWNAYLQKARAKERLSQVSLLITIYPTESVILAVSLNITMCTHVRRLFDNKTGVYSCDNCGMTLARVGEPSVGVY